MLPQKSLTQLEDVRRRLDDLGRVAPRLQEPLAAAVRDLQAIGASWQQTHALLQAIAELTSDYGYSCSVDAAGVAVTDFVTEGFTKATGYTLAELQARGGWPALIHPDDYPHVEERMVKWREGQRDLFALRIIRKDGVERYIRYSTYSQWDPVAARVVRLHGAVQDVTEQVVAEEDRLRLLQELEREHGTLQMVLNQMPACVAIVEPPAGRLIFADSRFEGIFRFEAPPTNSLSDFRHYKGFHPDGRPFEPEDWPVARAMLHGETVLAEDIAIERGDGTRGVIRVNAGPVRDRHGKIILAVATFFDVTEERDAAMRLHASNQRLQALSQRLVTVQEAERRAVAQELHDEIGQSMTGLKLSLEALARGATGRMAEGLEQACSAVNQLFNQVRNLSLDLRPAMLDDLGLYPALRWLIGRYQTQTSITVDFQHAELHRRFVPELETAAFRIVQEGLSNVARHAGVKEVAVRAWSNADTLGVQIEDRGVGFSPEAMHAAARSSGLSGMQERVTLLGGQFTVDSRAGEGTRLTAEFPLGQLFPHERRRTVAP